MKRFINSRTLECIVFGYSKPTICNFSGECKDCPKYKQVREKGILESD